MPVTVHFEVKDTFQEALSGETVADCLEKILEKCPGAFVRIIGAEGHGVEVDPRPEAPPEGLEPTIRKESTTGGTITMEDPTPVGHA